MVQQEAATLRLGRAIARIQQIEPEYGRGRLPISDLQILRLIQSLNGSLFVAALRSNARALVVTIDVGWWAIVIAEYTAPLERATLARECIGLHILHGEPGVIFVSAGDGADAHGTCADAFALVDLMPVDLLARQMRRGELDDLVQQRAPHWRARRIASALELRLALWSAAGL